MRRLVIVAAALTSLASASAAHALSSPSNAKPSAPFALTCADASDVPQARTSRLQIELVPFRIERIERTEHADTEDSVPWCMNSDDPRCSPIDGGSLPPDVSLQPKLSQAATLSLPMPRATAVSASWRDLESGAPRDGARLRLDRPPE